MTFNNYNFFQRKEKVNERDPGVEATESTISPGILPTGENGILLVIRQNGKEIVERITLTIVEQQVR